MTRFVFCHHAERADRNPGKESKNFPGITEKGETQIRKKTKMLVGIIESMPSDSALILGGCSKAIRTASTLAVFTDELRRTFVGRDVIFSTQFNSASPHGMGYLRKIAEKSGKGKVIVDFPLHIDEFIAPPGQEERTIAKKLLFGLCGAERFFRRFFPNNPLILVNVGHSREIDALINRLSKENGSAYVSDKTSFSFM